MSEDLNHFFFGIYPYLAVMVFVVGCFIRYEREQYTWHASSSLLLDKSRSFMIGNNLFHWGILLLFAGHFVGLLTPHAVYEPFISAPTKQLLAMIAGGIFGSICFIGMTLLVFRRLFNPRVRKTSRVSDILILLLLYVQLMLGLISIGVSAHHLDGGSMMVLASWAQHIITFQAGAATDLMGESIIFKAHIVLGLTLFVVFPFTRLVHVLSAPMQYLWRTGYQIVRARTAR